MAKSESIPKTPDFTYDALRSSCRALYDISTSTFDGATALLDKNKRYTTKEVNEIITKWSKGVAN